MLVHIVLVPERLIALVLVIMLVRVTALVPERKPFTWKVASRAPRVTCLCAHSPDTRRAAGHAPYLEGAVVGDHEGGQRGAGRLDPDAQLAGRDVGRAQHGQVGDAQLALRVLGVEEGGALLGHAVEGGVEHGAQALRLVCARMCVFVCVCVCVCARKCVYRTV